jgi:hypothetical protein
VELRRALLLFAVVLAVAAIVSSIANPPERGGDDPPATDAGPAPTASAPDARRPLTRTVGFPATAKPRTRTLEAGQPATVRVEVETPGQVEIPSLGLTAPAEPLTPAVFEVLVSVAGEHPIVVQPAGSETLPSKIGTLEVVPGS